MIESETEGGKGRGLDGQNPRAHVWCKRTCNAPFGRVIRRALPCFAVIGRVWKQKEVETT